MPLANLMLLGAHALCSRLPVKRRTAGMVPLSKWQRERRSMRVVIIMWYMCRRSEKQQISIPGRDFPWDTSWKQQRPKIRTLITCLALVVKLLYVFSSAVLRSISWWNLSSRGWRNQPQQTRFSEEGAVEMGWCGKMSCLLQISEIKWNMFPREAD